MFTRTVEPGVTCDIQIGKECRLRGGNSGLTSRSAGLTLWYLLRMSNRNDLMRGMGRSRGIRQSERARSGCRRIDGDDQHNCKRR